MNNFDKENLHAFAITKNFIKNNIDILFRRTDKGSTTVAMNKFSYIIKMQELFNNKNTYMIVQKNPINRIISDLH